MATLGANTYIKSKQKIKVPVAPVSELSNPDTLLERPPNAIEFALTSTGFPSGPIMVIVPPTIFKIVLLYFIHKLGKGRSIYITIW